MFDSLDPKRTNQEDSQKMIEFVYKVNFEAGKGQNYLHIFACIGLWIKACHYLNKFDDLYHDISIKSLKVDTFKDLIGKIKKIISEENKAVGSASSVPDTKYTEWNKLLCQIIILASFTKINQARVLAIEYRQSHQPSFLMLIRMIMKVFNFSKIFNYLGIRSESDRLTPAFRLLASDAFVLLS